MGLNMEQIIERKKFFDDKNINITKIDNDKDYVFVSYKSDNWEKVFKDIIFKLQQEYGLRVYCDAAFESSNSGWLDLMQDHVYSEHCKAIICFISLEYLSSYATLLELMYNRFNISNTDDYPFKPVIPVILESNLNGPNDVYYHSEIIRKHRKGINTKLAADGKEREFFVIQLQFLNNFIKFSDDISDEDKSKHALEFRKYLEEGKAPDVTTHFTYDYINLLLQILDATNYNYYELIKSNSTPFYKTIFETTDGTVFDKNLINSVTLNSAPQPASQPAPQPAMQPAPQPAVTTAAPAPVGKVKMIDVAKSENVKIGELVRNFMRELSKSGRQFTPSEFENFCDNKWGRAVLGLGHYPLMKPYNPNIPLSEQNKVSGHGRFWSEVFKFGDVEVLITSEWYKSSRDKFIAWSNTMVNSAPTTND